MQKPLTDGWKKVGNGGVLNPLQNQELLKVLEKGDDGIQFSHTLEEQIRGQLKAGFKLLDLYEDTNGAGFLHEQGIPTFWATLGEKEE